MRTSACRVRAFVAMLTAAAQLGAKGGYAGEVCDFRKFSGDYERVVGYAGIVVS